MKTGTLMGFEGLPGSGIAYILIRDDNGVVRTIPCENAPTMRALLHMFGDEDGVVDAIGHARVKYERDGMGLLESLALDE